MITIIIFIITIISSFILGWASKEYLDKKRRRKKWKEFENEKLNGLK